MTFSWLGWDRERRGLVKKIKSPNVGISANTDGLDFVQTHTVSILSSLLQLRE